MSCDPFSFDDCPGCFYCLIDFEPPEDVKKERQEFSEYENKIEMLERSYRSAA